MVSGSPKQHTKTEPSILHRLIGIERAESIDNTSTKLSTFRA